MTRRAALAMLAALTVGCTSRPDPPDAPVPPGGADGLRTWPRALARVEEHGAAGAAEVDRDAAEALRREVSFTYRRAIPWVIAFVPPVHPVLSRDAAGTSFERLTEDMVAVLRAAEQAGLLHYVETRSLADFAGDSTLYATHLSTS